MAYMARFAILFAMAVYCVGCLAAATGSNDNSLHTFAKRGTGVGELDENSKSTMWNKKQGFGCGNNICYSPSCMIGWNDSHGCSTSTELGGICDDLRAQTIHKNVCGTAWTRVCGYTNDYIAAFVWNANYQLTATTTAKKRLPAGFTESGGKTGKSCKYGMLLSNNYRGDFSCTDLLNSYRTMLDRIPYDGC